MKAFSTFNQAVTQASSATTLRNQEWFGQSTFAAMTAVQPLILLAGKSVVDAAMLVMQGLNKQGKSFAGHQLTQRDEELFGEAVTHLMVAMREELNTPDPRAVRFPTLGSAPPRPD